MREKFLPLVINVGDELEEKSLGEEVLYERALVMNFCDLNKSFCKDIAPV